MPFIQDKQQGNAMAFQHQYIRRVQFRITQDAENCVICEYKA